MKKVHLVLNRANTKVGMKESEVETALERKIRYQVPSDRAVPVSINRGTPVVLADAGADFSSALRDVAKAVANPDPDKQAKRRRLFAKA
jgi:pilus assembly protein CpaE